MSADPFGEIARSMVDKQTPKPAAPAALQLRQGVVTATSTGPNAVSVTLGGETTATAGVRYLASYTPTVNDSVWVLVVGRTRLVLGKLA